MEKDNEKFVWVEFKDKKDKEANEAKALKDRLMSKKIVTDNEITFQDFHTFRQVNLNDAEGVLQQLAALREQYKASMKQVRFMEQQIDLACKDLPELEEFKYTDDPVKDEQMDIPADPRDWSSIISPIQKEDLTKENEENTKKDSEEGDNKEATGVKA